VRAVDRGPAGPARCPCTGPGGLTVHGRPPRARRLFAAAPRAYD